MSILWLAVIGHIFNAVAFLIDKMLLTHTLKRSATYAALIGVVSIGTIVAAPWVREIPTGPVWWLIIGFGGVFVFALWAFFEALQRSETSRVVPIAGSLIPIFTLLGTTTIFHERLHARELVGFAFLILATVLLTRGGRKGPMDKKTLTLAVASAFLFAIASLCGKAAFDRADFLAVFVASRVIAGAVGLAFILAMPDVRRELNALQRPIRSSRPSGHMGWLTVFGQVLGACGFLLVHLAIAHGSVSIVNALQAIQYAMIVLVAWLGGKRIARALHEDLTFPAMLIKSSAILFVGAGLWLVSVVV